MEKLVEVKIPINYVRIEETGEEKLVYGLVEVTEENANRYNEYCKELELIFLNEKTNQDLSIIRYKISDKIIASKQDKEAFQFLVDNQWILKFASQVDIKNLLRSGKFPTQYVVVDMPIDAYIDDKCRRVFTTPKQVPIWKQEETKFKASTIEWLFLDELNTLEERIKVILLSDKNYIRNIIKENPWILIHVNRKNRIKIMRNLNIPFSYIDMVIDYDEFGFQNDIHLGKTAMPIPRDLISMYQSFSYDIEKIFTETNEKTNEILTDYCYVYAKNHSSDGYSVLRHNLWILEYINPEAKDYLLGKLGLEELREKRRFMTFYTKPYSQKLYSKQVYINSVDYPKYQELNNKLFEIFRQGAKSVSEDAICDFILSDRSVLEMWPWLSSFVKDPVLLSKMLEDDEKKKK